MTEISARSILASVSPEGIRLDTIVARYPLWIHAELMTHRVFSRNAASNRAIPFARMAATVRAGPAVPLFWTSEQKGMQGQEIEDPAIRERANAIWNRALKNALADAEELAELRIHKQAANRLLMPFQHITVQITSTDWANFDALRDHPDAEPHMRELAATIKDARRAATVQAVGFGGWHLPWVTPEERERLRMRLWPQQTLSVARSASISYDTVDGQLMTEERAQSLVAKLMAAPPNPVHASPFEHQAMPDRWDPYRKTWESKDVHGNLFGWMQYRKMLTREAVSDPGRERFR